MAIMGYPLQPQRQSVRQKAYVVQLTRAGLTVHAWPRKRGTSPLKHQRESNEWLKSMVQAYKMSAAQTLALSRKNGNLLRIRPQDRWLNVTSGRAWLLDDPTGGFIYPRRFLFLVCQCLDTACAGPAAMAARAADQWRPLTGGTPGSILTMGAHAPQWSNGAMIDTESENTTATTWVSHDLDSIGHQPGSLLYRGATWWEALPPGQPGQVLTINDDGFPEWMTP